MEQAGMFIAKIKVEFKAWENSYDTFLGFFQLSVLAVGSVKSVICSKQGDEKKTKNYTMLSKEIGCNSRGRSPSASAEASRCRAGRLNHVVRDDGVWVAGRPALKSSEALPQTDKIRRKYKIRNSNIEILNKFQLPKSQWSKRKALYPEKHSTGLFRILNVWVSILFRIQDLGFRISKSI